MFRTKKRKQSENENDVLDFVSKNYVMKENYISEDLYVANLEYISSDVNTNGPILKITTQKYIFEEIIEGEQIRYREIFTGFIADSIAFYFDLPYVVNVRKLKEEIPDIMTEIPKFGLLLLIDDLNTKEAPFVKKFVY